MAGDSFNNDLEALLRGARTPVLPATSRDPLADLMRPGPSGAPPMSGGSVDISALLTPPPGVPSGVSSVPSLADLLNPPVGAPGTSLPGTGEESPLAALLREPVPIPAVEPPPVILPPAATVPASDDALSVLLGGTPTLPELPVFVPAPPAAAPPPPTTMEVPFLDLYLDDDDGDDYLPPGLDGAVARQVPGTTRVKLPHAQCPSCGKAGIPALDTGLPTGRAAVVAGLAYAEAPSEGWKCLGCGHRFLSRESAQVTADDAAGHTRLLRLSEKLVAALRKTGYAGF